MSYIYNIFCNVYTNSIVSGVTSGAKMGLVLNASVHPLYSNNIRDFFYQPSNALNPHAPSFIPFLAHTRSSLNPLAEAFNSNFLNFEISVNNSYTPPSVRVSGSQLEPDILRSPDTSTLSCDLISDTSTMDPDILLALIWFPNYHLPPNTL